MKHSKDYDTTKVNWIVKNSPAFDALSTTLMDAQIINDIKHLTLFCKTGLIETYHSMILKYRPKRLHFKYDPMEARTKLAALYHNHNVVRLPAEVIKKDATGSEISVPRKNLEFPRVGKNG